MRWGNLRSWWVISGLVLVVVALSAVPVVVKTAHVGGPTWLLPVVTVMAGVLLGVWKPLLSTRSDALTARTRTRTEQEARAAAVLQAMPTRKGKMLRVEEVTSREVLNIHQAIPLPTGHGGGLSADLPEYVTRDIDADLRTFLTARSTAGGFALLLGPAAAGKTRTAYEALRHVLPRWRMLMPSTGTELNELVASGSDLTRSVVWLNETQDFLTSSNPLSAATIRRLLADTARPVILIGTIWPDRYDQLRTPTSPPSSAMPEPSETAGGGTDGGPTAGGPGADLLSAESLGRNARDVLDQARPFPLPRFSDSEWQRATELAPRDPRLEEAARHRAEGLGLTQILSAAPELIHRWEQGDSPYGRAVLSAAVTVRRCGHPETIPASVLQALAERGLTGTERAAAPPDWFSDALTWACQPVHHTGDIAPLRRYGLTIGRTDGYRVTDILTNHIAISAPAALPDEVWHTLITTASPLACYDMGYAAFRSYRLPQATAALIRAAEAGNADAMFAAGALLWMQGDTDGARIWFTRAAEAGDITGMVGLGNLLWRQDDTDGARTWFTRAAEAGETNAMVSLGMVLERQGDTDGARTWFTRAAEAGETDAMAGLGMVLERQGDTDGARTWLTRTAEAGDITGMVGLGNLLWRQGDRDGARTWFTRAVEADETGATAATASLRNILAWLSDTDGTRAAEAGDVRAEPALPQLPEHTE